MQRGQLEQGKEVRNGTVLRRTKGSSTPRKPELWIVNPLLCSVRGLGHCPRHDEKPLWRVV